MFVPADRAHRSRLGRFRQLFQPRLQPFVNRPVHVVFIRVVTMNVLRYAVDELQHGARPSPLYGIAFPRPHVNVHAVVHRQPMRLCADAAISSHIIHAAIRSDQALASVLVSALTSDRVYLGKNRAKQYRHDATR